MRLLVALLFLSAVAFGADEPTKWAVIVAGSNGWGNYRHQADVCHAYHVLSNHGIPDSNIVVMMYDDIAGNSINPFPGKLYNKPDGPDVYKGVIKDYVKHDVTPKNFLKVLLGEEMTVGSKKTLKSGPNDHVFVFFSDHGATGLIAFPSDELHVKELNSALLKMHADKKFGKLVFYLETCESGSMFRNVLPKDIGVYAMTASDYDESSWGCYCHNDMGLPCLGDLFSVSWMEDSDKPDLTKETLAQQHEIVKNLTNKSRVQQYGDLTWQKEPIGNYQGGVVCKNCTQQKTEITGLVSARDIPLFQLQRQMSSAKSTQEREQLLKELVQFQQKRLYVDNVINEILSKAVTTPEQAQQVMTGYPEALTQLDCHQLATKAFSRRCFSFARNEYVMKYSRVLANMCETTQDTFTVIDAIYDVCTKLTNKPENVQ
jgi:legumain